MSTIEKIGTSSKIKLEKIFYINETKWYVFGVLFIKGLNLKERNDIMKKLICLLLALMLTVSTCVTAFAEPPVNECFNDVDEMKGFLSDYAEDYPNVLYDDGITVPEKGYRLENKEIVMPTLNGDKYVPETYSCAETRYGLGIDYTYNTYKFEYNIPNVYGEIRFLVYYCYSEEAVKDSVEKMEEERHFFTKGTVCGYDYAVTDYQEEGYASTTYKIAVGDVLIVCYTDNGFERELLDSLAIEKTGIVIPVYEVVPQEPFVVSDELLEAVRVDENKPTIEKEDIIIMWMASITENKTFIRYSLKEAGYPTAVVTQRIGDYEMRIGQRPLPKVLVDGVLYELKEGYESGVLTDADFEIISGFEYKTFSLKKVVPLNGDANGDNQLSILDATHIQMYIAGLVDKSDIDLELSDMDSDGDVSVMDATAVQLKLAGIE